MIYDVIIIGAGPAGLTAAIYAKRACLNMLVLQDKYSIGSQICNTYEVCNYPGFNKITGQELYDKIKNHATELAIQIASEKVVEISDYNLDIKKVKTKDSVYETKSIVIATGASPKKAGFQGEEDFIGKGISYCATCDGAFYKDKEVAVIGGGDVAVEDAIYLSRIVKVVYLLVRKDKLRATKILQEEVSKLSNVQIIYETQIEKVYGNNILEGALMRTKGDIIPSELTISAIFVGIGITPETLIIKDKVDMEGDYIKASEDCATSVKGIYAIGDVRKKQLRQVITACSDGANAITSIQKYLTKYFKHNGK